MLFFISLILLGYFYLSPWSAFKALCIGIAVGALTDNPHLGVLAGGFFGCLSLIKWLDDPQ